MPHDEPKAWASVGMARPAAANLEESRIRDGHRGFGGSLIEFFWRRWRIRLSGPMHGRRTAQR